MKEQDDLINQTAEAKNAIESYIYDYQPRIQSGGDLHPYVSDKERVEFLKVLDEKEGWLSCDGEKETKETYRKVMEELQSFGNPIQKKKKRRGSKTSISNSNPNFFM